MYPGLTSMVHGTRKGEYPGISVGMNALLATLSLPVLAHRASHEVSIPHPASCASSWRRWISQGKGLVGFWISGVVGLCVAVTAEKLN